MLANLLALLGSLAATIGTQGCSTLICDEAKMPKSLVNK